MNNVDQDSQGHLYVVSPRGYSAYEIAVQEGFVGTEDEWLASLVGPEGEQGPDGKSAYEIALENGYIGTEEEWVNDFLTPDGYYNKKETDSKFKERDTKIEALESGTPLVASSTAEMTDTSRVYLNTTDGYIYYYDNDTWNQGWLYQSYGIGDNSIKPNQIKEIYGNTTNYGIYDIQNNVDICTKEIGKYCSSMDASYLPNYTTNANYLTINIDISDLDSIIIPYTKSYVDITGFAYGEFYKENVGHLKITKTMIENNTQNIDYDSVSNTIKINLLPFKTLQSLQATNLIINFPIASNYYISLPYYDAGNDNNIIYNIVGSNQLKNKSVTYDKLDDELKGNYHDFDTINSDTIYLVDGTNIPIYYNNFVPNYQDFTKLLASVRFVHGGISSYDRFGKGLNIHADINDNYNPHQSALRFTFGNQTYSSGQKIQVVSRDSGENITKKVLVIGDSLTQDNRYILNTYNKFVNDSMNIEFVGTRGSGNGKNEGRAGWNSYAYVTQSSFNNISNAFWNPATSKFDFSYYCTTNNINPDIVFINLGTNEITASVNGFVPTIDDIGAYWDEIIQSIHDYNPDIVICAWLCAIPCQMRGTDMLSQKQSRIEVIKYIYKTYHSSLYLMPVFPIICDDDYPITDLQLTENQIVKYNTDILHYESTAHQKISVVMYGLLKYLGSL